LLGHANNIKESSLAIITFETSGSTFRDKTDIAVKEAKLALSHHETWGFAATFSPPA
jgi:hypothetical protein